MYVLAQKPARSHELLFLCFMGILLLYSVQLDDIFSLGPFILEKVIPVCQKKIFRQVYEPSYENSMKRYLIRLYQTKRFPLYRDIACWSVHRKIFVPYERNLFDTFSLSRKIIYNIILYHGLMAGT